MGSLPIVPVHIEHFVSWSFQDCLLKQHEKCSKSPEVVLVRLLLLLQSQVSVSKIQSSNLVHGRQDVT